MYAYFDECLPINAYSQTLSPFHKILNNMEYSLRLVCLPVHVLRCSCLFIYFYETQCGISTTRHSKNGFTASLFDIRSHIAHCWSLHQSTCEVCSCTSSSHIIIHDLAPFPFRGVKLASASLPMINFLQYQKWRQQNFEAFTFLGWNQSLLWCWVTWFPCMIAVENMVFLLLLQERGTYHS